MIGNRSLCAGLFPPLACLVCCARPPDYGKLMPAASASSNRVQRYASNTEEESRKRASFRISPCWKGVNWKPSFPLPLGARSAGVGTSRCSAMVRQELGPPSNIHLGGSDLIFPHHENEIARQEAANGEPRWAHYWLHTRW